MALVIEPAVVAPTSSEGRALFRLALVVAVTLVAVLAVVSYVVWDAERTVFIMFVPVAILEWAFAGGMVAVLHRLAYRKDIATVDMQLYTWAFARPLIGVFTGGVVYFIALAGAKLLDGSPAALQDATWLNVVAFAGGFSDELSIGALTQYVRRRLGAGDR